MSTALRPGLERVTPSEVIPPNGMVTDEVYHCPYCGATEAEAPEGVLADGTPVWNSQVHHCWRCGFRQDLSPNTASLQQMQNEFLRFQQWRQEQNAQGVVQDQVSVPGEIGPPASPDPELVTAQNEVASLRAQLEELQRRDQ